MYVRQLFGEFSRAICREQIEFSFVGNGRKRPAKFTEELGEEHIFASGLFCLLFLAVEKK